MSKFIGLLVPKKAEEPKVEEPKVVKKTTTKK